MLPGAVVRVDLENDRGELASMAASLRRQVDWWEWAGIRFLPRSQVAKGAGDEKAVDDLLGGTEGDLFSDHAAAYRAKSLHELRAAIGDCRRCQLWSGRTHIVFGVGNPKAALMFVGEGPGRDEDLQGEPFVGRAGQLLTDIITKGMGLKRADVYIANVIKCRPPQNRNPDPDEVQTCEPFLFQQIDAIKPRVIVALGKFAAQTLLRTGDPISRLRGRLFDYRGAKLIPTFHPAYLLRNPSAKREVLEDMKLVRRLLQQ